MLKKINVKLKTREYRGKNRVCKIHPDIWQLGEVIPRHYLPELFGTIIKKSPRSLLPGYI